MGYDESGKMDGFGGVLRGITQYTATNGKVKVENRRNRSRMREMMRRVGRPRVDHGVREDRTFFIRFRWISVIVRRVDSVHGALGELHVSCRRLQAQLRGCKR